MNQKNHIKRNFIVLLLSFIGMSVLAQKSTPNIDYAHPYVSKYGFIFHTTDTNLGNIGTIWVECDKLDSIWLRYNVSTPYDVDEIVDSQGRHTIGQYTIAKGKNLYLKLDNDEILTLRCGLQRKIHNGYYTGRNSIYKQYDMFCYFKLTADQLQNLKNHEIIKMRGELKYEVMDMRIEEGTSLASKLEELQNEKDKKSNQENDKEALKKDPLKGF